MKLVFWQGIISIHQQSFLEAVATQTGVDEVLLVVEQEQLLQQVRYRQVLQVHSVQVCLQ